ncbi:hypothetical protein ACIFQM_01045 [Paenibacillus sp. NRS-1782]|uniref:hypothetical protein n=1 Tax=unclassified Paenibacillus TaxID=185978 RepID=UPI003D286822
MTDKHYVDKNSIRNWIISEKTEFKDGESNYARGRADGLELLLRLLDGGKFHPDPPQQQDIKRNDKVTHTEHPEWGWGKVILIKDATGPEAGILFSNHKGTDGYYPFDKLQKVEGEEV